MLFMCNNIHIPLRLSFTNLGCLANYMLCKAFQIVLLSSAIKHMSLLLTLRTRGVRVCLSSVDNTIVGYDMTPPF